MLGEGEFFSAADLPVFFFFFFYFSFILEQFTFGETLLVARVKIDPIEEALDFILREVFCQPSALYSRGYQNKLQG